MVVDQIISLVPKLPASVVNNKEPSSIHGCLSKAPVDNVSNGLSIDQAVF